MTAARTTATWHRPAAFRAQPCDARGARLCPICDAPTRFSRAFRRDHIFCSDACRAAQRRRDREARP